LRKAISPGEYLMFGFLIAANHN